MSNDKYGSFALKHISCFKCIDTDELSRLNQLCHRSLLLVSVCLCASTNTFACMHKLEVELVGFFVHSVGDRVFVGLFYQYLKVKFPKKIKCE